MWSTPMMKGRVLELLGEMGRRPVRKSDSLTDLAEWIRVEFEDGPAIDPRAGELVEIADAWLDHHRGKGA
jgi:hypothetical protein